MITPEMHEVISMLRYMDQVLVARRISRQMQDNGTVPNNAPIESRQLHQGTRVPRTAHLQRTLKAAPRFAINAKVLLHRHKKYIKGMAINVSRSGMFVTTGREIFAPNEVVRVYIKPHGQNRGYHAMARVIRFNKQGPYPTGYGLKFVL